jgi:glycine/D-amino acid oxidase-like deaminating enzyme/nitrite reductase/ring-hydroxylating ferredoxin subunit
VVGGGLVGLTVADRLRREGVSVAVIESQRVGAQVTGRSTAKLTALHGLIYTDLIRSHGEASARLYAEANLAAIEYIGEQAAARGIDCQFERTAAYTYTASGQGLAAVRDEVAAMQRLGLGAEFVKELPLPFPVAGAVCMAGQARFHPRLWLVALAQAIPGDGSHVFERTRVLDVHEGSPHRVVTDRGSVLARHVVIATNLPILDRGLFFAKAYPRAHVVLAVRLDGEAPDGMFLGIDAPRVSLRGSRDEYGPLLVVTGAGFRPGHADVAAQRDALERFVRDRFPVQAIPFWWSNEDYDAMDRVPFAGCMTRKARRLYTATGFSGWGLSNGTAAGLLLADRILERPNPYAELYAAPRWRVRAGGREFLSKNLHVGREFVGDRLQALRAAPAERLARGEGGLARFQGELVAAYKDEAGALHTLSPRCTHMGCLVAWNRAEQTWDCPCHGSRFDRDGRVLHGPAVRDLCPRGE